MLSDEDADEENLSLSVSKTLRSSIPYTISFGLDVFSKGLSELVLPFLVIFCALWIQFTHFQEVTISEYFPLGLN